MVCSTSQHKFCNFVQVCPSKNAQDCRGERLANAIMICDEYTWSSAGEGKEGHGKSVHCTDCTVQCVEAKTILHVKYYLRKESSGKTHLPIINSDRQARGTGGHT